MNVFEQLLDSRADARAQQVDADLVAWLNAGVSPEARLLAFDKWVGQQLATRLDWAWAGDMKARKIEQFRVHLERLVLDLWRRGWMLDGERLQVHIETAIDRVGKYQRAGKIEELWPYFRSTVDRYVGANAEEIQAEAMRAGTHIGQLLAAFKVASGPTLPELVAQRADEVAKAKETTLRERLAKQRRKEAARAAEPVQGELL